jgi:hypothetical protein
MVRVMNCFLSTKSSLLYFYKKGFVKKSILIHQSRAPPSPTPDLTMHNFTCIFYSLPSTVCRGSRCVVLAQSLNYRHCILDTYSCVRVAEKQQASASARLN